MRVFVSQLPASGVAVEVSPALPWAAAAVSEALDGAAGLHLRFDLRVEGALGGARVQGHGEVRYDTVCDRCGAAVQCTLGGPVDLLYVPDPGADTAADARLAAAAAGERALSGDQLDVGFLEPGGVLDLGAALAEQVVLWAPMRVVCDDPAVRPADGQPCAVGAAAPPDPGPAPGRSRPFAGLRLPE